MSVQWVFISCGLVSANGTISLMAALNHRHHPPLIHWHRCCQHLPKGSTFRGGDKTKETSSSRNAIQRLLYSPWVVTHSVLVVTEEAAREFVWKGGRQKKRGEKMRFAFESDVAISCHPPHMSIEQPPTEQMSTEHWAAIWVISSQPPHGQLSSSIVTSL